MKMCFRQPRSSRTCTRVTAGKMLSNLARKALTPTGPAPKVRNGVPLLPRRPGGRIMTMKLVNELRDEE